MSEIIAAAMLRQLVDRWIAEGKQVAGPRESKHQMYRIPNPNRQPGLTRFDSIRLVNVGRAIDCWTTSFARPTRSRNFSSPGTKAYMGIGSMGNKSSWYLWKCQRPSKSSSGRGRAMPPRLPILDHMFNWDFADEFYNRRRELTTIVTLACREHDAHCFCTCNWNRARRYARL